MIPDFIVGHHQAIIEQLSELITSLGALSTGSAALMAAYISHRSTKRRGLDECDKRIDELGKSFYAGLHLADERPKPRLRRRKSDIGD